MSEKGIALVLNDFWGKVVAGVMISFFVGGIGYAINSYAAQQVFKDNQDKLIEAKLPERMVRIEQKVEGNGLVMDKIDKKMDKMLDLYYRDLRKRDNNN